MAHRFPPKPDDPEARIWLNTRILYTHAAQSHPKPQPPTAVTRGFENYAFPKIVAQIRSDDPIISLKAVVAARELLIKPERLTLAVAAGITTALVKLLRSKDASVRHNTAVTLQHLAVKEIGCNDAVQHGALPLLVGLLSDVVLSVTAAAFDTIAQIASWPAGQRGITQTPGAITALVGILKDGSNQDVRKSLNILTQVMTAAHNDNTIQQIMSAGGLPIICKLLEPHKPQAVLKAAADLLSRICANSPAATDQATAAHGVPYLVRMLQQGPSDAQLVASNALGYITVILSGKQAMESCEGGLEVLVKLLVCAGEELTENLLQCIQNSAELPANRDKLQKLLVLYALEQVQDVAMADATRIRAMSCIDGVKFRHWPFPVQRLE